MCVDKGLRSIVGGRGVSRTLLVNGVKYVLSSYGTTIDAPSPTNVRIITPLLSLNRHSYQTLLAPGSIMSSWGLRQRGYYRTGVGYYLCPAGVRLRGTF